jgi:hypothetical protein
MLSSLTDHKRPLILVAASVTAIAGIALWALTRSQMANTPAIAPKAPSFTYDQALENPLDDGRKLPLADARPLIPFEIALPDHRLANRDTLVATWISPNNHVALRFSTDVLIVMQLPDFDNAALEFGQLIASGSVKNGRLDIVQNETALVMEPDSDVDGSNPGSLQFVRNGVSITVYGRDLTGTILKEIANTIS